MPTTIYSTTYFRHLNSFKHGTNISYKNKTSNYLCLPSIEKLLAVIMNDKINIIYDIFSPVVFGVTGGFVVGTVAVVAEVTASVVIGGIPVVLGIAVVVGLTIVTVDDTSVVLGAVVVISRKVVVISPVVVIYKVCLNFATIF